MALASAGCRNTTAKLPERAAFNISSSSVSSWATAIAEPGLPNLHKVSDDLYRGAQPSDDGLRRLPEFGIRTVVNVRGSDDDLGVVRAAALEYHFIPMSAWNLRDRDIVRFLRIATNPQSTPVFLHCQHGADRTGMLCAMYRIAVQGWSKQDAIEEMTCGGMGFHSLYGNLVRYVQNADIDRMRHEAGIFSPSSDAAASVASAGAPAQESGSWVK
jgi:tyrosine-protein phosphatase SIW14